MLTASVLASNLPDLDLVYVGITQGRLGYLLHHRGHTHTLLGIAGLSALVAWLSQLGWWWAPKRRRHQPVGIGSANRAIGITALACGALHLLMDWHNNYGVHPFWPWSNRWWYGDALFIVEPWLLLGLSAPLISAYRRWWARLLLLGMQALLVWLALRSELASAGLGLGLLATAIILDACLWRTGRALRVVTGGCALLLASCVGHLSGSFAQRKVVAALPAWSEESRSHWVRTPAPGNPLCWWVMRILARREPSGHGDVEGSAGDAEYEVLQAQVSLFPELLPAERCPVPNATPSAPLRAPQRAASEGIHWLPSFRAPLAELRALENDCHAKAFLRFGRAVTWTDDWIGDLRYDRSPGLDFAELELAPNAPCPRWVPPWQPPLSPLLEPPPPGPR